MFKDQKDQEEQETANNRVSQFQRELTRNQKHVSFLEELKDSERWNLSSARHDKELLEIIFQNLTNPRQLKYIWAHCNKLDTMCKLVVQPSYSKLRILNIGGNNLVSVEPLRQANMESLEQLWLWRNNLTKVDSLRKLYAPNLKNLDLSSNLIVEIPRFSEFAFTQLQMVNVQRNKLACIDSFAKNINPRAKCMINFYDNQLVRVFGNPVNMKKKNGKVYHFEKEKVEYV